MERQELWDALNRRLLKHFNNQEVTQIKEAYNYAYDVHLKTPNREDGNLYINHPVAMVHIILGWGIYDADLIILTLLHDTLEESNERIKTFFKIVEKFGPQTAARLLVLTKSELKILKDLYLASMKMFGDWRVFLVKFADTLHNLRTLKHLSLERRWRKINSVSEHFEGFHEKIKFQVSMGVFTTRKPELILQAAQKGYEQIILAQQKEIRRIKKEEAKASVKI